MRGLGAQADFKDLRGPRPGGMPRWRSKGAELVARARERMVDGSEKPWTVEELEWLASDEGEAFTRKHRDFSEPGVAISPRGWYRVESDCGYETLLGVASTVEKHHERLSAYFGSDPFNGRKPRQGVVRIVPDPSGLEAEGAPFFWVGGFQGGDTTVLRFSVGTIPGLGRGLTHELTHRFDGALHPGIPAWLAEGRATWTGAAYAFTDDPDFAYDHCDPGALRGVLDSGHASLRELESVVRGEPEDYRWNYSVGNALYVFLRTWFEGDAAKLSQGTPIFAERLVEFEDSGDHSSSPKGRLDDFEDHFCDGEDGRPSSFDGFQEMFAEFLAGFDPERPEPWTKRYRSGFAKTEKGDWVYDEPTWTWDWNRAEPVFGQNQARLAGLLLAEHGERDAAIRALVWARAVDGYDRRIATGLEQALGAPSRPNGSELEALWVTAHERRGEPFHGVLSNDPGPSFPSALPAVWEYHERLLAASAELGGAGLEGSSARLALEARRVAAWAGIRVKAEPGPADGPVLPLPGLAAELGGWEDEELTSLDKNRPKGLYRIEPDGSLLLGRRERQAGTGEMDRRGGGKSFLRADRWMLPGSYSISTRVSFTTGANASLAVLGWTSRERNVRLRLTAIDWDYAKGDKESSAEFKSVNWSFNGLRTRDGGLPGSAMSGAVSISNSQTSVQLELLVEGSAVSAWIAGQYAGTYHTIDGAPIEGFVGFGTGAGAAALSPLIACRRSVPARRARPRTSRRSTWPGAPDPPSRRSRTSGSSFRGSACPRATAPWPSGSPPTPRRREFGSRGRARVGRPRRSLGSRRRPPPSSGECTSGTSSSPWWCSSPNGWRLRRPKRASRRPSRMPQETSRRRASSTTGSRWRTPPTPPRVSTRDVAGSCSWTPRTSSARPSPGSARWSSTTRSSTTGSRSFGTTASRNGPCLRS